MNDAPNPAVALVNWVLWFSLFAGMIVIQMLVGHGIPSGPDTGEPPVVMVGIAAGLAFGSLVVRFLVLPMKKEMPARLPLLMIGMALAEACMIVEAILIPVTFGQTRLWIFAAAVVCALLQAPVWSGSPKPGGYQR